MTYTVRIMYTHPAARCTYVLTARKLVMSHIRTWTQGLAHTHTKTQLKSTTICDQGRLRSSGSVAFWQFKLAFT